MKSLRRGINEAKTAAATAATAAAAVAATGAQTASATLTSQELVEEIKRSPSVAQEETWAKVVRKGKGRGKGKGKG